jgi:hypothetical protein
LDIDEVYREYVHGQFRKTERPNMQQLLCKQTVMCVWDRAVSVNALGIILVQNVIGFDAAAGVMTAELR